MQSQTPENSSSRELIPAAAEHAHPALPEPIVGEYYGRPKSKPVIVRSYLHMFLRQRWTILLTFLLIMGIGLGWTITRPRMYRSSAEILITPLDRTGDPGNVSDAIYMSTRVRSVATQIRLLRSPDLLDAAFARLPNDLRLRGFRTAASAMSNYPLAINNAKDTDVISIEVTARNPEAAAAFANSVLSAVQEHNQDTIKQIANRATGHIAQRLHENEQELQDKLASLATLKKRLGVTDINEASAAEMQWKSNLEAEITQAQSSMERARNAQSILKAELGKTSEVVIASREVFDNPAVQAISNRLEQLEQERTKLLGEYLPTAPEIKDIDAQIAQSRESMQKAMNEKSERVTNARNQMADTLREHYTDAVVAEQEAKTRLGILQNQLAQLRGRMRELPAAQGHIDLLQSRIAELHTEHAYLVDQQSQLLQATQVGLPNIMPITQARVNPSPVSPNIPSSMMLLLVLATLAAVGLAVLRDQLDDRLHSADTLESLAGRRVLATLPQVRNGFQGLVTEEQCPAALLESFRILRGSLLLSMLDPLPRIIMVTSPQSGDGKSTTVANLAATTAISGKRVLLIDCDMRHPSVHFIYDLSNGVGLSTILQGEASIGECIQTTEQDGLFVLTAGPTPIHPPELLGSSGMRELLGNLRDEYDCILLDSTPVINLSDPIVLSALADGIIMVVSADRTHQYDVQTALRMLEQTGTPILGLVHNRSEDTQALDWSR